MSSEDWHGKIDERPSDSRLPPYAAGTNEKISNLVATVPSPEESISFRGNHRPIIGTAGSLNRLAVSNYGSVSKGHHHSSKYSNFSHNLGSPYAGVQEEGNSETSMAVHLSVKPNAKMEEPVVKQATKASLLRVKRIKCCCSVVFTIIIVWLGFLLIEVFPYMTTKKSIIFKDSIVLLARVDPFWYSLVTVSTDKSEQDHLLHTYLVNCDNIVVDNNIIRYNRTLEVDQNIMLLDPTFMIDGTALDFIVTVLNSSDNGGLLPSLIISDKVDSQDDFKQNRTMRKSDIMFEYNISKITDSFSFTTHDTGYFYIGFRPAGNIQFQVSYDVLGYKYIIEPTDQESSCSTQRSGESCSVGVPTTLSNLNSDYYCVLCKLESSPFYVNQYRASVDLKVRRSVWNMFTIAIFVVCSLITLCGSIFCVGYSVSFVKQRCHRGEGYTSIQ